jgi:hypothetical protein
MDAVSESRERKSPPKKRWLAYAAGSEVDHFAKFCREHLVQSEDRWEGKPLVLEPWQRRMLGEALAFDSDGWPTWRSVFIVAPRKNGKTAALASLSLNRLLTSAGRPEILLAAPSDRVAGRLFDAADRAERLRRRRREKRSPSTRGVGSNLRRRSGGRGLHAGSARPVHRSVDCRAHARRARGCDPPIRGTGVYRWSVEGDELTLTLVRPESGGCTGRSDALIDPRWRRA